MDRSLRAPDRGALWTQLAHTRTQLAELCGVSLRQVAYWAKQGILTPVPGHADLYWLLSSPMAWSRHSDLETAREWGRIAIVASSVHECA